MSRFFDVPMEYFIFGDKLTQEFRDAELRALTQEADRLKSTDRKVIKSYIKKFLKAKRQMDDLVAQAEEEDTQPRRKKSAQKNKKNQQIT